MKNSPGHRPRACQITGNNPLSWLLFPSGTGLKVSLSSERIRFIVSLGGGVWAAAARGQCVLSSFQAVQKSLPKSIPFPIDFEAQMLPKSIQKSLKIHSRSHPETNPPKITKIHRTKPLQTLKIELSCTRGASFHIFTISKKNDKIIQQPLKSTPTTTQHP